jgi:hypothetical protein
MIFMNFVCLYLRYWYELFFIMFFMRKNGHMTITILSIAHMGIPNISKISSLYTNNQLLIGLFPRDLCLNIYDERGDLSSTRVGTSLCSVSFQPSTHTPPHPPTPLHTPQHPSTPPNTPPHPPQGWSVGERAGGWGGGGHGCVLVYIGKWKIKNSL